MIVFISDLHLDESLSHLTVHFCHFLKNLSSEVTELYILGDLFETWLGDDDLNAHNKQIIEGLREISNKGIKLYIQHGNRDFLLSKKFAKQTNAVILPDEHLIEIANKRILLMHGDTLCQKDIAYQKMRRWLRNPIIRYTLLKLPLTLRKKIARQLRDKSKSDNKIKSQEVMDVVQSAVLNVIDKHNAELLIHGHTHLQNIHSFSFKNKLIQRIVLPAWHDQASALVFNSKGNFSWLPIY